MVHEDVRAGLRDVAAGLLTPFNDDGEIDHNALASNAQELFERGIRTFLANANISEYHSLAHQERIAVTETATEALPDDATILGGIGGSTKTAKDLIDAFDDLDVDAMMLMPPDHTYIHERGLLAYYQKLAEHSSAPIVPYIRGFEPSVEFLADLTRVDGVVGIKYAIEDVPKFTEAVGRGAENVVWVDGMAEPYALSLWNAGAEGFTAGVSNFAPRIGLALYNALSNEEWERARELQRLCQPFMNLRGESGVNNSLPSALSVPAVKAGMDLAGFDSGTVREPIVDISQEDQERVEMLYEQINSYEIESVVQRT